MEVEKCQEENQVKEGSVREPGRVGERRDVDEAKKTCEGSRERHAVTEEERLERKYRSRWRLKREDPPMNMYKILREGKKLEKNLHSTVEGNVQGKGREERKNKNFVDEENRQRHVIKEEKRRGEKKPPSPSEWKVEEMKREEDDERSDKQREGKRPRLKEGVEGDLGAPSTRKRTEEEKVKEEEEDEEEEEEKDKGEDKKRFPRVPQYDVQAFTASQEDTELLQRPLRSKEVDEEWKPREEFSNLTTSECECEVEEKIVMGSDGAGVCRREACFGSVTPRPRHSPHTVSIRALPMEEPRAVKLTPVSPQDIVSSSIMEVRVVGLRGEHGSVTDPRLGPAQVNSNIWCSTCTSSDCLGHSGYIDLREYVFHPAFVMRCVQTLRKLCYHCLGPAELCQRNLDKTQKAKAVKRRQPTLTKMWVDGCASDPVEEPSPRLCAKKQPMYHMVFREGVKTVELEVRDKEPLKVELSASTIREIFAEVSENTWQYLGMKDPSDEVFLRYLRVCPTSCRSASKVNGQLVPHSLTVLYNDVVNIRNELDHINQQIEELMTGQDEMVRCGVHMVLKRPVDTLTFPGHPAHASKVVLDKGRGTNHSTREDDGNENSTHKEVNFTSDLPRQDVNFTADAFPKGVDATYDSTPKETNFISEAKLEERDENSQSNLDNDGKVEIDVTASTAPPLAEWLLAPDDDDDEMGMSGFMEQASACEEEDDEREVQDGDGLSRTDRLRRIRQHVQKVAVQVTTLHRQARKQHLALTSAVDIVVQEQVSKIPGKQGVMRQHLLGKRVNQCARAVFRGDNSLPLGVVGVPHTIATRLFQYVHVHECNLKECEQMIDRFPDYPCVVSVIRGDRHFDMQAFKDKTVKCGSFNGTVFHLHVGDVVQRHLKDGDQVVVNRQPTLAKANMETHTVRVTDSRTISLNISITDNYAADCDGDEMNIFVPGVESHSSRLLNVSHNVIFSKSGKVSLRIKQDALRGAYSASLQDTFLTLDELRALAPSGSQVPPPSLLKPRRLWTGLQLLSLAFPPNLTVDQVGVGMHLDTLLVRHGNMLSGVFNKSSQDKIMECCKMFLDHDAIMTTVKCLQGIAERFVDEVGGVGFSFLPEDWSCPADTLNTMREELQDVLSRAQNIQCPRRRNAKLRQLLADQASRLVPELKRENNAAAMLKAGSKKRPQKLVQVCLAVGQHNQNDQLPPKHLDGRRVLPFFSKDDTRPQAEGFVDQPLFGVGSITADALGGMVARSSTYKKHCATGESGYLQRKLGKLMEDLTVRHDGTVRDANNEIVQLLYGDDGLLPDHCFTVTLRTEPLPNHVADFYHELVGDQRLSGEQNMLLKEELWSLWSDQKYLSKEAKGGHIEASVPFHLPHLMAHVLATVPASGPPPSVTDIMSSLKRFFAILDDSIEKPMREELQRRKKTCEMVVEARCQLAAGANKTDYPLFPRPNFVNSSTFPEVNVNRELAEQAGKVGSCSEHCVVGDPLDMLKRYVRQHVNTFNIRRAAFSMQQFSVLLDTMTDMYLESRPAAGECVGALAAQALAEPLMQMTLNACHRAAVASDGDAIPRLTELLNGQAEDAILEASLGGLLHAREYLVQEISQVYAVSGETIDMRHVRLVVDYMLKEGAMSGYTRHHIPPQVSFLKAAAFEQPLSLLQHAGTRSRGDDLLGVSENLILDKEVDVGPDAYIMTWLGSQKKTHTALPPQPLSQSQRQQSTQPSHDELTGASHKDHLTFELDDDDEDDAITIPELDELHASSNSACHAPPGTGQGGAGSISVRSDESWHQDGGGEGC